MFIKCFSAALQGIHAELVTIEIHAVSGADFSLVGLPDNAIKESRDRIRAAMLVNGFKPPVKRLTINLSPADLKKEGTCYDLPLAIGMLHIAEEVPSKHLEEYMMAGELSLDGQLQPIHGALPIALLAREQKMKGIILPLANAQEAAVVDGVEVIAADSLLDVVRFLRDEQVIEPFHIELADEWMRAQTDSDIDFSDIRGQQAVRRAMEVAAAGGHNLLMVGPPGAGKSMLAKRLPTILPPLTLDEALETTKIHSVAGLLEKGRALVVRRPFRSPHHTVTDIALIGGGTNPRPGEISLAHNGVLFLDEVPEYKRSALEVLRQPLEDRKITVARSKQTIEYPASFMLVAAMNPCPCGHYGDPHHPCTCTPTQIHRYKSRISGPLLDRIDIQCEVQAVPYELLRETAPGEPSSVVRERVVAARLIQQRRFAQSPIHCNAQMSAKQVRQYCAIDNVGDQLLRNAMERFGLSARAYDRILKVARTIADLEGQTDIQAAHLVEAISYRRLDRDNWGE
ncbi:MAG: YifB family Mg chelatase-like AAA ATPase [Paludibacteraceae bacterium]|nr:YifB family Mg chelatase-like AAA ATPase [Paludibacteraceae bacterium]